MLKGGWIERACYGMGITYLGCGEDADIVEAEDLSVAARWS